MWQVTPPQATGRVGSKDSAGGVTLPAVPSATPRESNLPASDVARPESAYKLKPPPKSGQLQSGNGLLATSTGTDGEEKIHDIRNLLSESFGATASFATLRNGSSLR